MPTQIIPDHLRQQLALVGFQYWSEQDATVEGALSQHPIAPAMNGRDRRLVLPLTCQANGARNWAIPAAGKRSLLSADVAASGCN